MELPKYDEGAWPIVRVTMPKEELDETELLRHIDRLSSYHKRGQPHVQIIDVRGASSLSARSRRLVMDRLDQDEETYPGQLLGIGIVLATPVHRGIFTALSWLARNPRPFEAFSELEKAELWARGLLETKRASDRMRVSS